MDIEKEKAAPEWISTEDKEPVENGNYLVCIDGDVFYLTAKWVKNHFKFLARGYGLTEDFTDWRYCEGVKVTHWMLLPDSPKAQEPSNNVAPELVNNDATYVIELQGCEAIEHARVTLKKKGYKTWDYTDKDSIDDADIYVLCVCPSTPNDSALVKGTFKGIHQGKFTYIQTDLESCPDAQEQKG